MTSLANLPFPRNSQALVDTDTGRLTEPWLQFFAAMVARPGPIVAVSVGTSPFSYTASQSGFAHVTGGTVSAIALKRADVTLATGLTAGFIPVGQGDIVVVTYSVLPTIKFVPS